MSSSGSAYAFKPGGLKFKGGDESKSKKKRKKERSSTAVSHREKEAAASSSSLALATRVEDDNDDEERREAQELSDEVAKLPSASNMTEAERKFQEVRMKRMRDRVKKEAKRSHKDKVDSFNKYLEAQTDHFDLPRIGPG